MIPDPDNLNKVIELLISLTKLIGPIKKLIRGLRLALRLRKHRHDQQKGR